MELWIAEKRDQAARIARALGGSDRIEDGAMRMPGGRMVWAQGHLLELERPEGYDPRWTWSAQGVMAAPFVPDAWRSVVTGSTKPLLDAIKRHARAADVIVITTDADPAGELIAREALAECRLKRGVRIERMWIKGLNDKAIQAAAAKRLDGRETERLADAARLRQRSDWVLGMSATVVVTMKCRPAAGRGAYSLGRVQTPTLAMIVDRAIARETFVAEPVFGLKAMVETAGGERLAMEHRPKERVGDRAEMEARAARCRGASAPLEVETTPRAKGPPAPFSLASLQQHMSRRASWTAARTLEAAQRLYEAGGGDLPAHRRHRVRAQRPGRVPRGLGAALARAAGRRWATRPRPPSR